jgi:hypothetical protein
MNLSLAEAGRLAERIAAAVTGCPSVVRLATGPVATYLPGRIVPGVAVREDKMLIAVVAALGSSPAEVAEEVRVAARRVVPGGRVDVLIEDIEAPGGAVEGR